MCCSVMRGSTDGLLFLRNFSDVDTQGIFRCHNTLFLSGPHLCFILGLIRVFYFIFFFFLFFFFFFLFSVIIRLGNVYVDQMFQTNAEAKG